MARLREEPDSDDGSSPDEGVPNKFAGHRGIGEPMQVGVGYTQRELCDGGSRLYPTSAHWNRISNVYRRFTDHHGTEELLVSLAMGKVDKCPFPLADIAGLKKELIDVAAEYGFHLERRSGDRTDVPIDFRFLHRLLVMAGDPEVDLGDYSQGVRVGPGTVTPRLPAFTDQRENGVWLLSMNLWVTWSRQQNPKEHGVGSIRRWRPSKIRSWNLFTIKLHGVSFWF